MGWQHLRMGIHIHTGTLGLLQEHFKISQVMTRNENTWIFVDTKFYLADSRISVSLCICLVQKSHSFYTVFSGLHGQRNQVIEG